MMRILLTGADGQVGWELQRTLMTVGEVVPFTHHTLDLIKPDVIRNAVREIKPDLIINAAGYTAVDKAEVEPELAMMVNGTAPGILAEEAKRISAVLIHYSTDYVFDGRKDGTYTEDDEPNPLSVYGRTKLAGEKAVQAAGAVHLIFRTSWVYGVRGNNFLLTMLRLAKERKELRIVSDQVGTPTWSRLIAEITARVITRCLCDNRSERLSSYLANKSGIYNLTAADTTSWFGFASQIFDEVSTRSGISKPNLIPIPALEYSAPAYRPANSRLSNAKLFGSFGVEGVSWKHHLRLCLDELANA